MWSPLSRSRMVPPLPPTMPEAPSLLATDLDGDKVEPLFVASLVSGKVGDVVVVVPGSS